MLYFIPFAGHQEATGNNTLACGIGLYVAGNLLKDKFFVGKIHVKAVYHVIAVPPGVGPKLVMLKPIALGKADHIQPVASPAFTVMGRCKQPLHEPLNRSG